MQPALALELHSGPDFWLRLVPRVARGVHGRRGKLVSSWLRHFPRERLELLRACSVHRLDRLRSKLPLLTGSIEKLGILPLAAGLFLQLKDLHWPLQLHRSQILLIAFLMLCWWAGMLQLGLRFRLEQYEALLEHALDVTTATSRPYPGSHRGHD